MLIKFDSLKFLTILLLQILLFRNSQGTRGNFNKGNATNPACVETRNAIKSELFAKADENILKSGETTKTIKCVVRNVYAENIDNFIFLKMYAWNSSQSEITFYIMKDLWNLMLTKNDLNINILCDFYEIFREKVISSRNTCIDCVDYATLLLKRIIGPKIEFFAAEKLKSFLLKGKYTNVLELADRVFLISESIFDKMISIVISEAYNELRFRQLLYAMWNHKRVAQKAIALSQIFWNLYFNIDNNGQATLIISYYFYKLKNLHDYKDLSSFKSSEIERCLDKLPKSVYNLYFAKTVCLQNVRLKNYLIAGEACDESKHNVMGQRNRTRENGTIWLVEPTGEMMLKFRNQKYGNELLYAGDTIKADFWRNVFTQIAKDKVTGDSMNKFIWNIELYRNELIIKNSEYDQDMCLVYWKIANYQEAVTARSSMRNDNRCRWTVNSC